MTRRLGARRSNVQSRNCVWRLQRRGCCALRVTGAKSTAEGHEKCYSLRQLIRAPEKTAKKTRLHEALSNDAPAVADDARASVELPVYGCNHHISTSKASETHELPLELRIARALKYKKFNTDRITARKASEKGNKKTAPVLADRPGPKAEITRSAGQVGVAKKVVDCVNASHPFLCHRR